MSDSSDYNNSDSDVHLDISPSNSESSSSDEENEIKTPRIFLESNEIHNSNGIEMSSMPEFETTDQEPSAIGGSTNIRAYQNSGFPTQQPQSQCCNLI